MKGDLLEGAKTFCDRQKRKKIIVEREGGGGRERPRGRGRLRERERGREREKERERDFLGKTEEKTFYDRQKRIFSLIDRRKKYKIER